MKKYFLIILMGSMAIFKLEASAIESNQLPKYEMPGTQVIPLKDTASNKQYELLIKVPESYAKSKDKKYPVIYFTDAVWHIELLSSASYFMMEEVILVGISWQKDIGEDVRQQYGAHFSRYSDYSFKKTANPKHPKIKFGQAPKHLNFIRNDVFNYVEKNYRADPENRTYFGFSAGGAFGSYALVTQPESFKNYILGSPSIWKNAPELFAQESNILKSKKAKINVFISYGALEEELRPYVDDFTSRLKNKNYQAIASVKHLTIENSGHSDSSPLMAMHSLKWLSALQPKGEK